MQLTGKLDYHSYFHIHFVYWADRPAAVLWLRWRSTPQGWKLSYIAFLTCCNCFDCWGINLVALFLGNVPVIQARLLIDADGVDLPLLEHAVQEQRKYFQQRDRSALETKRTGRRDVWMRALKFAIGVAVSRGVTAVCVYSCLISLNLLVLGWYRASSLLPACRAHLAFQMSQLGY